MDGDSQIVNSDAATLIERLGLTPHPEGGYYREVYRSASNVRTLDHRGLERSAGTAVYFLLADGDFSAFNQVQGADELWHLYAGGPLEIHVIQQSGHTVQLLSNDLDQGEPSWLSPQEGGKPLASRPGRRGRSAAVPSRRGSISPTSRSLPRMPCSLSIRSMKTSSMR